MSETEFQILRAERHYETLPNPVTVYGIRAGKGETTLYEIADFSLSESYTLQVIGILREENPEDVHIAEIIEDFVY